MRGSSLVDIDRQSFAEAFARRSVYVKHGLSDHPLFTLDAIAEARGPAATRIRPA